MSKNKAQHYLSAFYLYNFTNGRQRAESGQDRRKTKVFHYDLRKEQIKERPIENIATESYLFSSRNRQGRLDHSVDDRLRAVEVAAANGIEELIKVQKWITKEKPRAISLPNDIMNSIVEFIAWQIFRHPDWIADVEEECRSFLSGTENNELSPKKMALNVIESVIDADDKNIRELLLSKNKTIIFNTSDTCQFITCDKPFVRFNKHECNGIGVESTEMYFPLSSNMLLYMKGNGAISRFIPGGDRVLLRKLNIYMAKQASRYIIANDSQYLKRIYKGRLAGC